ncbi:MULTISPECIES: UTRA domain-containing protein [unclassified Streptomyces]|uniref:GntR family transcriptional regulator n=1 Tax=unclassified Streptomyces TaxID=2593676 RepID=UPI0034453DB7
MPGDGAGRLRVEGQAEVREGSGVIVRRRGIHRPAAGVRGAGRSVWEGDTEGRESAVEFLSVGDEPAPAAVSAVLGLAEGAPACVRRRRFLLDGKPVMLATSYLDAALVAGTPVTEPDSGPGGIYARLAELGHGPARFREEVRSRMPSPEETERLGLAAGTPVVLVCRTAFASDGRAVEVNEMVLDASAYVLEYEFDAP